MLNTVIGKVFLHPVTKDEYGEIRVPTTPDTFSTLDGTRFDVLAEDGCGNCFTMSCYSNKVILIPPAKSLLLHIWSDGFREWNESIGKGKPIHLASGARLKIDVQLEPAE